MHHRRHLAAAALALLLPLMAGCGGDDGDDTASDDSASNDDSGESASSDDGSGEVEIGVVQTYDDLSADHVELGEQVDYEQIPPVGGDHWEVWQNCGFYDEPVMNELAVHSMEHGAVWITYRPDLAADQVDLIRAYTEEPYVLASPWEDDTLPAPIVFSAWGAQLLLESLPAPEADEFMTTYREGDTAPEPGAPCTQGTDLTAAEAEAQLAGS
jgi:Protein of unknown function (DUF3105)